MGASACKRVERPNRRRSTWAADVDSQGSSPQSRVSRRPSEARPRSLSKNEADEVSGRSTVRPSAYARSSVADRSAQFTIIPIDPRMVVADGTRLSSPPVKVMYGGAVYTGEMEYERRHGIGKFVYQNGDYYDGVWSEGKAHGHGTYWTRQTQYTGEWEQDLKHGSGQEKFVDGTAYEGEFWQGYRHGHGTLRWTDGSTYEGQFAQNKQEGDGSFVWKKGSKYSGQWENNYIHGAGSYVYADGATYEGQFVWNLKDGEGVYTSSLGRRVECTWKDGRPTGSVLFKTNNWDGPPTCWKDGIMFSWAIRSDRPTPAGSPRGRRRGGGGDGSPRSPGGSPRSPGGSPRGGSPRGDGGGSPRSARSGGVSGYSARSIGSAKRNR